MKYYGQTYRPGVIEQVGLLHTTVRLGESLHDACLRAATDAGRSGLKGYVIDCEVCGFPVEEHFKLNSIYADQMSQKHQAVPRPSR